MGEAALSARSSHYRPRSPHTPQYYQCIEDNLETFEHVYDERFSRQYGFFRPFVKGVIYRYLDCGDLHSGFARIRCPDCGHEQLLAFSCKRRHFCPSCHQKRVVEFGEWLCMEVVKNVPHRHVVFSIPKILRRYFLYDRSLLSDLSRCAWETLKTFYQCAASKETAAAPGAVIAIQTFGDLYHNAIQKDKQYLKGILACADTELLDCLRRKGIAEEFREDDTGDPRPDTT